MGKENQKQPGQIKAVSKPPHNPVPGAGHWAGKWMGNQGTSDGRKWVSEIGSHRSQGGPSAADTTVKSSRDGVRAAGVRYGAAGVGKPKDSP